MANLEKEVPTVGIRERVIWQDWVNRNTTSDAELKLFLEIAGPVMCRCVAVTSNMYPALWTRESSIPCRNSIGCSWWTGPEGYLIM